MEASAKRFLGLFSGCENAHGQTTVLDKLRHGKQKAEYIAVREPLTCELIQEHLAGTRGIASIPIDEKSCCRFGALDIDDYNLDLAALKRKVSRLKLPLVMCRSKSGGAHLYLFLSESVPAVEVRDKLSEFSSALGCSTCEVFPKQEEVIAERGDLGNFLNLPYFNFLHTTRYALKEDGDSLTLDEFLDLAEAARMTFEEFRNFKLSNDEDLLPNGPPCLQQLTEFGIPQGGRNTVLFNVGIYLKNSSPETWKESLEKHNQSYCTPSLPAKEVVSVQEQLKKKEYNYQCKVEPLNSHCNRSLCRTRKFGISHHQAFPAIGGMTVVQSEPPVWFVDVDGARLELGTKQLQMQIDFQRACMEQMYKMPARMKESEWRDLIDSLMDNATRITVPEELTRKGQFSELLEIFCTGRLQAHTPEELLTGKPWTEEKFTYFKLGSLQEFLKGHGFNHYTRGQITERLKEMNNGGQADKQFRFKDNKDAWRKIRVWFVPEIYRGDVDFPPVTFEKDDDDVPF